MGLTLPYGQNHYMGEYATEGAALTWIRGNKWDSIGDGSGNPKAGMAFFDTAATKIKVHDGSAWVALGSSSAAGSTGHVQFNTGGAFDAEAALFWDKSNDRLGVGTSLPIWQVQASRVGDATIGSTAYGTGYRGYLLMAHANGTEGTPTTLGNNDYIGQISFSGHTGTAFRDGAAIRVTTSETWTESNRGCLVEVFTTANTTSTIRKVATFGQDGSLTMGVVGTLGGKIVMSGLTSGTCTVQVAAEAGTTTFQLPASNGTNGHFLQTNGNGVTTWASASTSPAGSTTQVQFNNAGAFGADSGFVWDNTNKQIGLSGSDTYSGLHVTSASTTDKFSFITLRRYRNTIASPSAVQSGDTLGSINFQGFGATAVGSGAQFACYAGSAWTDSSMPAYMVFRTTPSGSTTPADRIRITSDGLAGINVAVPSSRLDVGGDVEIASDAWHYYGDPTTDGSWRTGRVVADLVVQKRESGTWTTKHTFV